MKTFLKRLGICIGGLLLLLILFHLVENWRGKRAWTQWKRARIAAGDSFDPASLIPPEVPDAENFAQTPCFRKLVTPASQGSASSLPTPPAALSEQGAMGDWRTGRRADLEALQTNLKVKDLKLVLAPWETELAALTEAARRPRCRLMKDYEDMSNITPLLGMRSRARMLSLRALVELREKKADAALEDILTGIRVANHLQREPWLISQLLRGAWVNILMQPIWEGLQEHRWNEAQLARLQEALAPVDLVDSMSRALHFERIHIARFLEKSAEASPWSRGNPLSEDGKRFHILGLCIPKGWFYQNMVRADRHSAALLQDVFDPAEHLIRASASRTASAAFMKMRRTPYTFLVAETVPALLGQNIRMARAQSGLDMAIIACALERHRLAKGGYPETLNTLAPALLAKAPVDVVEGQPLKYAPHKTGFTLYSLGWDLTDEGGRPAPKEAPEKGDWVWSR